jgi:hypothetical protein
MMLVETPKLNKGDFARIAGKLKSDLYFLREGTPTGTRLIVAFEASKVSKLAVLPNVEKSVIPVATKE